MLVKSDEESTEEIKPSGDRTEIWVDLHQSFSFRHNPNSKVTFPPITIYFI